VRGRVLFDSTSFRQFGSTSSTFTRQTPLFKAFANAFQSVATPNHFLTTHFVVCSLCQSVRSLQVTASTLHQTTGAQVTLHNSSSLIVIPVRIIHDHLFLISVAIVNSINRDCSPAPRPSQSKRVRLARSFLQIFPPSITASFSAFFSVD
jgi:hypothetical protein